MNISNSKTVYVALYLVVLLIGCINLNCRHISGTYFCNMSHLFQVTMECDAPVSIVQQ